MEPFQEPSSPGGMSSFARNTPFEGTGRKGADRDITSSSRPSTHDLHILAGFGKRVLKSVEFQMPPMTERPFGGEGDSSPRRGGVLGRPGPAGRTKDVGELGGASADASIANVASHGRSLASTFASQRESSTGIGDLPTRTWPDRYILWGYDPFRRRTTSPLRRREKPLSMRGAGSSPNLLHQLPREGRGYGLHNGVADGGVGAVRRRSRRSDPSRPCLDTPR